jgi:hypothetical protein
LYGLLPLKAGIVFPLREMVLGTGCGFLEAYW